MGGIQVNEKVLNLPAETPFITPLPLKKNCVDLGMTMKSESLLRQLLIVWPPNYPAGGDIVKTPCFCVYTDAFSTFPSLQSLELSLNGIVDVLLEDGYFQQLQCLNLSYNNLSSSAVLTLGMIPGLKELNLTGNNLVALPMEMSMPYALEGAER